MFGAASSGRALASCRRGAGTPPGVLGCAGALSTSQVIMTNEARVKALDEAFTRGGASAVVSAFDPRVQWREAESFGDGRVSGSEQDTDTKQWAEAFGA